VKRVVGIAFGLALLMPTLQYEAHLFDRVTAALDGGTGPSSSELRPPVDVMHALDKVANALHVDELVD
jgi:hypothetical protein